MLTDHPSLLPATVPNHPTLQRCLLWFFRGACELRGKAAPCCWGGCPSLAVCDPSETPGNKHLVSRKGGQWWPWTECCERSIREKIMQHSLFLSSLPRTKDLRPGETESSSNAGSVKVTWKYLNSALKANECVSSPPSPLPFPTCVWPKTVCVSWGHSVLTGHERTELVRWRLVSQVSLAKR